MGEEHIRKMIAFYNDQACKYATTNIEAYQFNVDAAKRWADLLLKELIGRPKND